MQKKTFNIFSVIVFVLAIALLAAITLPLISTYNSPEEFKAFINSFGVWGFFVMLFIQVSQIIVALIPGEVVEFVAGTVYGWLGGLAFCLFGILIGQSLIFMAVKFFGRSFVEMVAGSKAMNKFKFLQNEKKLKLIIFFLFFIPGTPKDLITYIAPLTKIKLRDFLIITLFARIPSIVSSTYAGDAFANKDIKTMIVVYGLIIVFSICGVLIYRWWDKKHTQKTSE